MNNNNNNNNNSIRISDYQIRFIILKNDDLDHHFYHHQILLSSPSPLSSPSHQGLNSFINSRFAKNAPVFSIYPTKQTINALSANINSSSSSNTCWYRKSNSFFFVGWDQYHQVFALCGMNEWIWCVFFVFSKLFFCWIFSKMTFSFSWMMNVSRQCFFFHFQSKKIISESIDRGDFTQITFGGIGQNGRQWSME